MLRSMSKKIGVAPHTSIERAKRITSEKKGWRLVAPGKKSGRRAILIKKFVVADRTLALFQILPGSR